MCWGPLKPFRGDLMLYLVASGVILYLIHQKFERLKQMVTSKDCWKWSLIIITALWICSILYMVYDIRETHFQLLGMNIISTIINGTFVLLLLLL